MSTQEQDLNLESNEVNADALTELAKEYGFNPNGPKSAKEFIQFALENLPKKNAALDLQNKTIVSKDDKIAELEITLNQLVHDAKKQKELAYQQAEADIKAKRREAVSQGDVELVDRLDTQQEKLKADQVNEVQSAEDIKQQARAQILIEDFRERNDKWINGTGIKELNMQAHARMLEATMAAKGVPLKDQLATLDAAIQEKFPEYFDDTPNHDSAVESSPLNSNLMTKPKKTYTMKDLTKDQQYACNYHISRGTMTFEEYVSELIKQGDLK